MSELIRLPNPSFQVIVADRGESSGMVLEFIRRGWCARRVRGRKMETVDALFDEVSAAFQFPWYFGENWAAFEECINDLDWLEWRSGFAIIIAEADRVLWPGTDGQLRTFVDTLQHTIHEWADPDRIHRTKPEPINGVAPTTMPFRVILQVDPENHNDFLEQWNGADAILEELSADSWEESEIFEPRIDIRPSE